MPRDTQNKSIKKDNKSKSKKRDELTRRRKMNENSDSDDDSFINESDEEDETEEMDVVEYQKFLSKMFPSKYMNKKVKAGEDIKKFLKTLPNDESSSDEEEEEEEEEEEKVSKKSSKSKSKSKSKKNNKKDIKKSKSNKKMAVESDSSEEDDEDSDEDDDDNNHKNKKSGKFNIIFTIGNNTKEDDDDYDDDDEDEDDSDWESIDETEDEDESVSSDDSDSSDDDDEDEDEDDDEEDSEEEEEIEITRTKRNRNKNILSRVSKNPSDDTQPPSNINSESPSQKEDNKTKTNELLNELKLLLHKNANNNNKMLNHCIQECEEDIKKSNKKIEKKQKKQKQKNARIFKRILRDKNTMNDYAFFGKMNTEDQVKIIKEVKEINKISRVEKPYRMTILESNIPPIFKSEALKKISSLRYMEPGSGEYYKIKNWVDTFMRIPFNKFEHLPINISDGVEACHDFMANAQATLDSAVYGLNDAKMQIMQMLGQLITNPAAIGTAIAIQGSMGTGKTSLVKEGISKILNRPFAFISLGGATDSSFLEGHSYTYEGSVWGKIVQILIESKCMNPVIYFDELDKISDTAKGEEIAGILTHLTDTSQNSQFHDRYFCDIDFDLSKCLFIFSYNDENKVNPILRDRMYKIQTKGYDKKQKTIISNNYLLPKIREQVKFQTGDIIIPDDSVHYIIETHCNKEDGVRNLKRCLEIIYTKLNLYRLMKPGSNLFEDNMSLDVAFPFTVTKEIVDKLIKRDGTENNMALQGMYV
jgi:ATP-dependent Lon protease